MGKDKDKKSKHHKHKSKSHKHKSHKHKKHKASKDEERASVSSVSSSETASSSSETQPEESQLAELLSQACSRFPQLIEEFPMLLQALDADQGIQLRQLQNPAIRLALEEIFLNLPLEIVEEDGATEFYKSSEVDSVAQWLSVHLLARNFVAMPDALSASQLLATQGAIQAQTILKEFPEIRGEMVAVLETIQQGSFVQIDSLENERVKQLLKELFQALSLDYEPARAASDNTEVDEAEAAVETGYGLRDMSGDTANGLEYLLLSLARAGEDEDKNEEQSVAEPETQSTATSADTQRRPAMVGPAMPSQEQLMQAQAAAASYMQKYNDEDDEEEDDDFGPSMATPAQKEAAKKARAASTGPELLGTIGAAMPSNATDADHDSTPAAPAHQQPVTSRHGREEWMMTPGDSKLLGGLKSTLPTTRTFQRGKQAKAMEDERKRKQPQVSEEEKRQMEEALAEHKAKRGKSLVELHQDNIKAKAASGASRPKERRAFDRERDLTSRQMNAGQVQQLVAKAKEFDTRFSKSVQRTFL